VSTPVRTNLARILLLGAVAGLMAGLFGVGGGTILVPGLVLLLKMDQHRAHATSLAAIIVTAPAAAIGFALDGAVSVPAALLLALGAVAGAYGGASIMHRMSAAKLRAAFAILILLAAIRMVFAVDLTPGDVVPLMTTRVLAGLFLLGLAAGTLSAIMGVGGGVIMVPVMVLLFGFGQHVAEGTSLLVIVPTAIVGAWRHTRNGYTDWRLGLTLGAGGILGGLLGAQIALALSVQWLQRLFATLMTVTAIHMLRPKKIETGP